MYRHIVILSLCFTDFPFIHFSSFIVFIVIWMCSNIHTFGISSWVLAIKKQRKTSRIHSTMIDFEPSILFLSFSIFFYHLSIQILFILYIIILLMVAVLCSEQSYLIISSSFFSLCCHHQIAILTRLAIYENEKETTQTINIDWTIDVSRLFLSFIDLKLFITSPFIFEIIE